MSPRGALPPPDHWGASYRPPVRTFEESRRRRRRLVLLGATAPGWLTVLVLGFMLIAQDINTRVAIGDFDAERYPVAVQRLRMVDGAALPERWKTAFNLGTAQFRAGDLPGALGNLDRALVGVPERSRCMVQVNRAVVLEASADEEMALVRELQGWADQAQALVAAGEPYPPDAPWGRATPGELRDQARVHAAAAADGYGLALEARADPACEEGGEEDQDQADQEPDEPEEQEQEQDPDQQRVEQKQQEAQDATEPDTGEAEGEEQPPTPDDEEAARQQELEDRNAEAQAEAEAERQRMAGEGDGGSGGGDTKNW